MLLAENYQKESISVTVLEGIQRDSPVNDQMNLTFRFLSLIRCVVVVGLPYPNPNDPILKEKIKFIESRSQIKTSISAEFQENLCMRAVNQSIGRAIRHKNDYACIVLLDQRYSFPNSKLISKLPKWILSSLVQSNSFGSSFSQISKFFKAKHQH